MKTILLFLLGASIGSFLGLVIDRFPEESILFPASHCNHCKKHLKAWDLIPIISQLSTKSKCRYCHKKIPYWYAVFEFITGLLILLTGYQIISILECLLLLTGLVLAVYDIKHQEYPLMIWLAFTIITLCCTGMNFTFIFCILLAIVSEIYPLKIGAGDFLYLALFALCFSLIDLLWIIQISSFLGIIFIFLRKQQQAPIPFIPFLLLGFIFYLPFSHTLF
ncbi:prepilin peptidase [Streptococcus ovis]|uniref:prepilin peptidase n=1 Tax=Streptococcus ovis TaxID=82806 RepID=UPI00035EBFD0|nr:A24 family peptidase [Streptococcus ovis]